MHTAKNVYHKQPRIYLQSNTWWYQDITDHLVLVKDFMVRLETPITNGEAPPPLWVGFDCKGLWCTNTVATFSKKSHLPVIQSLSLSQILCFYLKHSWSSVNYNTKHCDQMNSSGGWYVLYSGHSNYELFNQHIQQATWQCVITCHKLFGR